MPNNQKINILMVDDQPGKLLSYEAILQDLGENLISATSGKEALDLLLKNDVAVILMDVSMPEINGFELAEMIHQHPRFSKIAILFISAVHLSDMDRIAGYQRGAMDYIAVPIVPELLRAKVSLFVDLYRKTHELEALNTELEERVLARTEALRESARQVLYLNDELQQRIAELETIMKVLPVGVSVARDAECRTISGNAALYDLLEMPSGSNVSQSPGEGEMPHYSVIQNGRPALPEELPLQRATSTGRPIGTTELEFLLGSGRSVQVLASANPLFDSSGQVRGGVAALIDITERKRMESQLHEQYERFQFATSASQIGYWFCNLPFDKVIWDDIVKAHFWLPPHVEVDMKMFYEGLHPDDRERTRQAIEDSIANHTRYDVVYRTVSPRGEMKWIHAVGRTAYDPSGTPVRFDGITQDVTERERLEQTLRERAELMELASEAIIVRDLDGYVRFWNSGAASLYGWTQAEMQGRLLHRQLRTQFPMPQEEIQQIIASGHRWEGNLVQFTKEGHEIVASCRKIMHQNGKQGSVVLEICRDITAQLKAEEALRRSEKLAAMGRMAGIVAHEINNPLGAITNVFYLLRNHPSLNDEARNYARMAEEELARVTHITKQTLGFYRESAQALPVSIPVLLDEILELQAPQMKKNQIELERRYRGVGMVEAFPGELKQVFLNLICNAMEAMQDGGRLCVRIAESYGAAGRPVGVRVTIADTGSGIKPEDASRMFEPFFSTKASKGTGLGLWISNGIVQKYEGTIQFRSSRFPTGNLTCFSVLLPASSSLRKVLSGPAARMEPEGQPVL